VRFYFLKQFLPRWSCRATYVPILRVGKVCACACVCLLRSTTSFWMLESCSLFLADIIHFLCSRKCVGMLGKMISQLSMKQKLCWTFNPKLWIGVLRYCNNARPALSEFKEPCVVFSKMILFAVFTASSARPLDWGYSAEDNLWWIPHVFRNFLNLDDVNCGPPSLAIFPQVPVWCEQWS